MYADARSEELGQGNNVSDERSVSTTAGGESGVPSPSRKVIHEELAILHELGMGRPLAVVSDGWRNIDVFLNAPLEDTVMSEPMIKALSRKMRLELYCIDPNGNKGRVVWCDDEFVSLQYMDTSLQGYMIWKRVVLGLHRTQRA